MSKRIYQMQIPVYIVIVFTAIFVVQYFGAPYPPLKDLTSELLLWASLASVVAMAFGYATLILMHIQRLTRRKESSRELFRSSVILATIALFLVLGFILPGGQRGDAYQKIFADIVGILTPASQLYCFHHIFAPYRMFRPRTPETMIMLAAFAFSVLRGMTMMVALWPPFAQIGDWIAWVPNMAAQRAALAAAGVGAVILAWRALVGKEPGLVEMEVR